MSKLIITITIDKYFQPPYKRKTDVNAKIEPKLTEYFAKLCVLSQTLSSASVHLVRIP